MNVNLDRILQVDDFYSRDGYTISFKSSRWKLNKDIEIAISSMSGYFDETIYVSFLNVFAFYAKSSSASHVRNLFERCKHYLDSTAGQPPFSVASLISYRASLDKHTEWYLGVMRILIRQWGRLGYPGIPSESVNLLDKWTIRKNEQGFAVQSMCPDTGPLTDIEMETIADAVLNAFGAGTLGVTDTAMALILAMTGRRPSQIAALKIKDLQTASEKYFVSFPRAKQRGALWRSSFRRFRIVEDLWLLLELQSAFVGEEFARILDEPVTEALARELPLFPEYEKIDVSKALVDQVEGDILHIPTRRISSTLTRIVRQMKLISERTGAQIHLSPRRFRYTLGTNLRREGRGEYIIAEALDHSDTQSVWVYLKNTPEIVERIDKAVAMQLAPIAQAFQGVLITSERDALRWNDPTSRISGRSGNVGSCGSYGFCSALAPVACYTCSRFQPWLDGPHEDVLDQLIEDRDRVFESTGDLKIASVNDRLILAVSDVLHRCEVMKVEFAHA
jgi:integrase